MAAVHFGFYCKVSHYHITKTMFSSLEGVKKGGSFTLFVMSSVLLGVVVKRRYPKLQGGNRENGGVKAKSDINCF